MGVFFLGNPVKKIATLLYPHVKVDMAQPAKRIHNFVRGLDSSPGAWTVLDGKQVSAVVTVV